MITFCKRIYKKDKGLQGDEDNYKKTKKFGGVIQLLYFDYSGNYMSLCVCQNSHNGKLKKVNFTSCKLHFNNPEPKKGKATYRV